MKKFNVGVLALILGLTLAVTGSAFTPATETIYWFESNDDGTVVGAYLPGGPACEEPAGDLCALGFSEEDIQDPQASTPVLTSQAQTTPLSYNDDESRKIE
ncbi:MAG: hypothetical protein V4721_02630 [Bacteroidota bacterium]